MDQIHARETSRDKVACKQINDSAASYEICKIIGKKKSRARKGWLNRYGLKNINLHGEMGNVDFTAIDGEMTILRNKLAGYDLDCILNMDETGLFFSGAFPNVRIHWETKKRVKFEVRKQWLTKTESPLWFLAMLPIAIQLKFHLQLIC
jgi:hypothetical protein